MLSPLLPVALVARLHAHVFAGELAAAASLSEECEAVAEATRIQFPRYGALAVAAWRGREAENLELIEATIEQVVPVGQGLGVTSTKWAAAVLYNGLGRYEDALAAAEQAPGPPLAMGWAHWTLVELIEAAARTGEREAAADALDALTQTTRPSGTDWALGVEARSRALLCDGEEAERLYREATGRLARTGVRAELARAHLVYGEWLRRERRRLDAREQLRTAHEMFNTMGAEAFARRAERELLATRGARPQAHGRNPAAPDRPGGPDRPVRSRRPFEPRNRQPLVHQSAHGRIPPAKGVHQAERRLASRAAPCSPPRAAGCPTRIAEPGLAALCPSRAESQCPAAFSTRRDRMASSDVSRAFSAAGALDPSLLTRRELLRHGAAGGTTIAVGGLLQACGNAAVDPAEADIEPSAGAQIPSVEVRFAMWPFGDTTAGFVGIEQGFFEDVGSAWFPQKARRDSSTRRRASC